MIQIENNVFLKEKHFKVFGVKDQLPISFDTSLLCNKVLKVRNTIPIKSVPKVIFVFVMVGTILFYLEYLRSTTWAVIPSLVMNGQIRSRLT